MPTYDYRCDRCGPFQTLRSIAERDNAPCLQCGAPSTRELVAAPALFPSEARRTSKTSPYTRYSHAAGCGCCSGSGGVLPRAS